LPQVESMLADGRPWLLGTQPTVADLAVYHPLWFTRHQVPVLAGILESVPGVLSWMDRMAAIGQGNSSVITADEALQIAHSATPEALPQEIHQDHHGIALGQPAVSVAEAFGVEPTEGLLVAASRTRYTLRREDPRAGLVHVHFPRVGYLLKAKEAAS
jgi:glutathione S-transferase